MHLENCGHFFLTFRSVKVFNDQPVSRLFQMQVKYVVTLIRKPQLPSITASGLSVSWMPWLTAALFWKNCKVGSYSRCKMYLEVCVLPVARNTIAFRSSSSCAKPTELLFSENAENSAAVAGMMTNVLSASLGNSMPGSRRAAARKYSRSSRILLA
jgi:hypothetical protein